MKITRTEVTIHSVEELSKVITSIGADAVLFLDHLMDTELPDDDTESEYYGSDSNTVKDSDLDLSNFI